jgi:hypothetical protein
MRLLLLGLLALNACTGTDDAPDTGTGPIGLVLVSPADGDTVCGAPLVVETDVQNFVLTNETIEDGPPNEGHLHLYLNGQEVAQSDQERIEMTDVAEAEYQLKVDLALANHQALNPYVGTTIYVTVDDSVCGG